MLDGREQGGRDSQPRQIAVVARGAESLLGSLPVASGRSRTRQILKAKGVRVMRLSLDAGQVLRDRVESAPMLIQTLQGRVILTVGGERVDMPPGALVHLDKQLSHSIAATEASHLMVTLIGPRPAKPRGDSDPIRHTARARVAAVGRIRLQEPVRPAEWARNNFVLSATGANSEAFEEITARHAELLQTLAVKTSGLLDVLAGEGAIAGALDELLGWARSSLLPYLALEAEVLYPVASLRPQQRPLVSVLSEDLAGIGLAVDRLVGAEARFDVAATAVALRVAVGRHLAAEADVLLPTLAVSSEDSFASLWASVNERWLTPVTV